MKHIYIKQIIMVFMLIIIVGCATMQSHWKETKSLNTIESYEKFLEEYPEGEFSAKARAKLEELYFKQAEKINTTESYEEFLKKYPEGKFADNFSAKLEELNFKQAEKINTTESYEEFLEKYPEGKFANNVSANLEDLYFKQAEKINTIESYEEFLKKYPEGKLSDNAQAKIDEFTNSISPFSDIRIEEVSIVNEYAVLIVIIPNFNQELDLRNTNNVMLELKKSKQKLPLFATLTTFDLKYSPFEEIPDEIPEGFFDNNNTKKQKKSNVVTRPLVPTIIWLSDQENLIVSHKNGSVMVLVDDFTNFQPDEISEDGTLRLPLVFKGISSCNEISRLFFFLQKKTVICN